jgi:hypothetical protein
MPGASGTSLTLHELPTNRQLLRQSYSPAPAGPRTPSPSPSSVWSWTRLWTLSSSRNHPPSPSSSASEGPGWAAATWRSHHQTHHRHRGRIGSTNGFARNSTPRNLRISRKLEVPCRNVSSVRLNRGGFGATRRRAGVPAQATMWQAFVSHTIASCADCDATMVTARQLGEGGEAVWSRRRAADARSPGDTVLTKIHNT